MAAFKSGVKMTNTYDTALAHAVIQYQNCGRSLHTQQGSLVSFNHICDIYGLPVNPMKKLTTKSSMLWLKENIYQHPQLSDEMKAYTAFDVETLLDLKKITTFLIQDDFYPLFKHLCENDIIRNIDPNLLKLRKNHLKEKE